MRFYLMLLRLSILLLVFFQTKYTIAQTLPELQIINFAQLESRFSETDPKKVRVFNFWATWCKPCVEELPYFTTLPMETNGIQIEVILVSLDFKSHFSQRLVPFVVKNNIQKEVVLLDAGNPNKWIDKVDSTWSGAIPATVFIYEEQRLFKEKSYASTEEIMEDIRSLLIN